MSRKCNKVRELDFNLDIEIKTKLRHVHYKPISIKHLEKDNQKLFLVLKTKLPLWSSQIR